MGSHRVGHNLAPKQQQCVCGERSLLQVLGYKLFFASLSERGHEVPKLLAYCFWCLTQNPSGFPERSRKINLNLSISNCWKTRVNESFLNFFTAIISSYGIVQFSSVHSLSRVQLFATPWIAARQASLSIINSRSSPKLMCIESVMPSSHLILCRPLLLPPIPPSIRVFSNESTLCMRWPKYWSFSFSIIPSKEHSGLISFRMDWLDLLAVQGTSRIFSKTTVQKHQFFDAAQLSSQSNSHIHTWPLEKP